MTTAIIYLVTATLLFALGVVGLVLTHHLLRKVLALNVMASAVFLLLIVLAYRPADPSATVGVAEHGRTGTQSAYQQSTHLPADPVPHALVLTGIVVAFGSSALAVGLARRLHQETGEARLPEENS